MLASKYQDFKLRGLEFHFIKQLKNGHTNFKPLKISGPNSNSKLFIAMIMIARTPAHFSAIANNSIMPRKAVNIYHLVRRPVP